MFSPGIEPGTFCVLDRCDNRYTTKTCCVRRGQCGGQVRSLVSHVTTTHRTPATPATLQTLSRP